MKSKKWLVLSVVVALVLTMLAGCGKSDTKDDAASAAPSTAASAAPDAGAGKLTGDLEIQYFVGGYGDKWWKQVIGEFQAANPDLKIKETSGPKINEQNKARWIGGTPPDFVYIDGPEFNEVQAVTDGQLEDLSTWITDAKNVDGDKILDILAQKPELHDGKTYSVPLVLGTWGMFWDKKLFADKGIAEPKDWPSFIAASQKLKDAGITPFIHTGKYPYYIQRTLLLPAFVSANNNDFSILRDIADLKPEVWANPAILAGLNKLVELRDKGFIDKASTSINHTDSQSLFLQHKDGFIPNGLWLPGEMAKDVPADFNFGQIPSVTQDAGGKVVANTSTATVAIAAKGKNKENAKAFLQFIFSKKQAGPFAELSGAPSNIKADITSSNALPYLKDAVAALSSDNTVVVPSITFPDDLDKAMWDADVALTSGKIEPAEWIKRVSEAAAKIKK
ncbi:extracellular solute-binding protein [Paenibacillus psychroresistens]|uniref:Extracellular solute-binding protein n=1 Tax=Paenibacillus psychroresistens TaxID=1778678 RepID=A0A6B8RKE3_9BACL|nr:extracellular solute-binding protein [Paenibacillus psychroresistens]QGQ96881.1 extracellular solute-binding protein [Paenibacillus psychroresistens]